MTYAFHLYITFWAHNTYVALFIHAMLALGAVAGIQTGLEDGRHQFYHPSTNRNMHNSLTDAEDDENYH